MPGLGILGELERVPFVALYETERVAQGYLRQGAGSLPAVCLLGESGVGKSHLARLIHALSSHSEGPFVAENCANLQETLAESALFGHARGAYTGAEGARTGLFEAAKDGVLFLDEIGNMSMAVQSKLLTVLDSGRFRRVGENDEKQTNCFVILATNQDPEQLCQEGLLRQDLWYRIQTAVITLPPLRERPGDIEVLCHEKLRQLNGGKDNGKSLNAGLKRLLAAYAWPGTPGNSSVAWRRRTSSAPRRTT